VMEASGHARWFERRLAELNFELWIGAAAEIRAKRVRNQKTDRQDGQHILRLLLKDRSPQIWVSSWENRDLRQLLWHRYRMAQARTAVCSATTAGLAQSPGIGSGLGISAGTFIVAASAGFSSQLRTSGSARRIARSPTRINSPARLKSS